MKSRINQNPKLTLLYAGFIPLVLLAALWWLLNLTHEPAYGDTQEFWELSRTLKVDSWRTLGYPLVLRSVSYLPGIIHKNSVIYFMQTGLAFAASYYFFTTLDNLGEGKRNGRRRFYYCAGLSLVLISMPLIAHFNLTILTDSLAASFFLIGFAALVRLLVQQQASLSSIGGLFIAIIGSGLIRPERLFIFAVVLVAAAAWFLVRRKPRIAGIAAMSIMLIAAVTLFNKATQTADLGRQKPSITADLFDRSVRGRLAPLLPQLSDTMRSRISPELAESWNGNPNAIIDIKTALDDPEGHAAMRHAIKAAIRCCGFQIAAQTTVDIVEYLLAPFQYARESLFDEQSPTSWTNSRMSAAHPLLTNIFTGYSFLLTAGLLLLFLSRLNKLLREEQLRHILIFSGTMILLVSLMYALRTGMDFHIRYALPVYMIEIGLLLWFGTSINTGETARETKEIGRPRQKAAASP